MKKTTREPVIIIDELATMPNYIQPVNVNSLQANNFSNGFLALISKLNPLAAMGNAISNILTYSLEKQKIEAQALKIKEQANIINTKIKKHYEVVLTDIDRKHKSIDKFIDLAYTEILKSSNQTVILTESLQLLCATICDPEVTIEEKHIIRQTITDLSSQLPKLVTSNRKQSVSNAKEISKTLVGAKPSRKLALGYKGRK